MEVWCILWSSGGEKKNEGEKVWPKNTHRQFPCFFRHKIQEGEDTSTIGIIVVIVDISRQ